MFNHEKKISKLKLYVNDTKAGFIFPQSSLRIVLYGRIVTNNMRTIAFSLSFIFILKIVG